MNPKEVRDVISRALNIAAVTNIADSAGMLVDADDPDHYVPASSSGPGREGGAFLLITDADGDEFLVSVMRAKKP